MTQRTAERSSTRSIDQLQEISYRLSRDIITMTTKAQSGHPSSSLSAIDVLTVLYFGGFLRYNAQQPNWPDRDRFIMSKGHASPGLYVLMAEAGYFNRDLLPTLREFGSPLEGHPVMQSLAGVEASTGSLGQGLSIGLGHALAGKLDKRDYRVYVMIGDGESDEGQIWEAAMAAAKYKASNLTAILDFNRFQQTGPMAKVMPSLEPVVEKWRAFGWAVVEIDGHDFPQIQNAFEQVLAINDRPQMIVAHTHKGKQLTPFEKDETVRKHGVALTEEEAQVALAELEQRYGKNGGR